MCVHCMCVYLRACVCIDQPEICCFFFLIKVKLFKIKVNVTKKKQKRAIKIDHP